ncbi:hypothetical protein BS50DRAFT_634594 [Corynespora cassiicola Philippines]|uniref:Uncharacterized protein n=1 Tax=Corynespora cassiicola Philippines TaxID=1448308 RepID=A0A2T2NP25_CORCC|nr:hypothetical protein BS50DRAFT_634594 [Corynespora cassiicola Philippines]
MASATGLRPEIPLTEIYCPNFALATGLHRRGNQWAMVTSRAYGMSVWKLVAILNYPQPDDPTPDPPPGHANLNPRFWFRDGKEWDPYCVVTFEHLMQAEPQVFKDSGLRRTVKVEDPNGKGKKEIEEKLVEVLFKEEQLIQRCAWCGAWEYSYKGENRHFKAGTGKNGRPIYWCGVSTSQLLESAQTMVIALVANSGELGRLCLLWIQHKDNKAAEEQASLQAIHQNSVECGKAAYIHLQVRPSPPLRVFVPNETDGTATCCWVWVSVNAKVNTGPENEITRGKAIIGNPLLVVESIAAQLIAKTVMDGILAAQYGDVFTNDMLPEKARKYVDAGAIVIEPNVDLGAVDVSGVYGRGNEFDVWGGEVRFEIRDEKLHVTGFNPLVMR